MARGEGRSGGGGGEARAGLGREAVVPGAASMSDRLVGTEVPGTSASNSDGAAPPEEKGRVHRPWSPSPWSDPSGAAGRG